MPGKSSAAEQQDTKGRQLSNSKICYFRPFLQYLQFSPTKLRKNSPKTSMWPLPNPVWKTSKYRLEAAKKGREHSTNNSLTVEHLYENEEINVS